MRFFLRFQNKITCQVDKTSSTSNIQKEDPKQKSLSPTSLKPQAYFIILKPRREEDFALLGVGLTYADAVAVRLPCCDPQFNVCVLDF